MSIDHSETEQATFAQLLVDAIGSSEDVDEESDVFVGARYSMPTDRIPETDRETRQNSCLKCNKDIAPDVARVLGDNDGNVEGCSDCRITTNERPYNADSLAVKGLRSGHGMWKEDYR